MVKWHLILRYLKYAHDRIANAAYTSSILIVGAFIENENQLREIVSYAQLSYKMNRLLE
jgi:hypothetical protein